MADFGGFEIEDDEKKPSSPSAFGGFEIEGGDEGESGETGPVSPAEASSPKSPAPTSESQSLAEFMGGLANGSASAPAIDVSAWESGDGGESTLPVGEKNQWGGNLRTEGRKPLIRRDANGKVNGYSTTTSMFVKHNDGRIAVVPTVVDGVELSTEDAAQHYADTGEYWGMADNEDGAKKIARAVHDEHQKAYQEGWNEYIQSHWDDMGDEIRLDPGVRGERARRRREARLADELKAWGDNAEVIRGYRERTKTAQVAPELFLTGDLLEDADGNAVKPGDAIAVYHKEGDGPFTGEAGQSARLMEYTGVNADGKPVFKETEGVSSEGAMVAGKLHVRDDDFASMLGKGEGKIELSPGERVRLNLLAETGNYHRYDDTLSGVATAIADRIVPYGGRIGVNQSREQLRHLSNIYENILDEYPGKTDDEKRSVAAMYAGLDPIRKGESRDEYYARIRREAEEELRKRVIAKKEAGGKLSETEQGVLDKILTGGIESGGYALEFAIPGGAIFKGAKALGWGAKAVRAATMLGSAVPVVAAESMSRYQENVTPEYGFDDNGEFRMVAAPDDEEEAAYKAIGGAIFDTAVEVGLEAATMGLLRGAGKATGWALGKATPSAVREFGAKRFSKFMASETGQALRSINRAYQDFSAMTQINSPLGELAEENVQAFEKVLGLDGKSSEYKGLAKEWQDFKDNQLSWQTQWDIFYGLIAQLAIGSAKSTAEGISQHISSTDARRDIRMALKRSGISDETISTLTPKQQKTLTDMWQRYSANPDALKDRVKNLGYSMRAAVDELTARDGLKMSQSLEQRGIAPEKFTIQTGEDGKPAFQHMMRFTPDGKQAPMNAMTDAVHGVTIVDQGDGTFYVMNDFRGLDAIPAYSFEEAQKKADEEVVRNQSMDADNAQKAQYLMGLVQRQYAGRNVVSIPSEAALRWQVARAVHDGKEILGITRADQLFNADGSLKQPGAGGFHTPDGHIVVILDNVPSPAEMERVLAHEATGHEGVESATGRGANTVEFIQNAQAEGFSKFVLAEQERAVQRFVAAGMDEDVARMQVAAAMSTDEYAREAMARYAQGRLHQPTWYEKRKHELNQRRRKAGEDVPIDQSDLEVMLAEAEKQGAQGANDLETLPGDSGVRYEEGATDEARNGADEAQPQQADEDAGRDGQQPAPQAAERPVEVSPPRAEAPDAGVVEPSKTDNGGQNLNAEAKKPKGKRGDNLRGRSYEDYAASPDDGGTADEMGAALLRFVRDNGGLLKMPPNGAADPMADWINAFLDGNARKNNRGEFVALFGMKPKTGANDAIAENMPSGLKEFVEGMIGRDGPGAVADWFLETRRKYREWAQNRRNAAQEATTDAVERYDFDELAAAQDEMDEEFANALGVLEGADEADYAMLTPENLKIAKSGDTIRFDHDRKSFVFGSYDAENGVLVVYDEDVAEMEGGKFRRAYRITENSIEEIEDGQENESGADANRAGNEEGSQGGGGGFQLESVTAEQITAEQKKRAEKEAIKKRLEKPLKGSGAVNVQPEMDLGQTGQQDLFSPVAEKPQATQKPDVPAFVKAQRAAEADSDFEGNRGLADLVESLPPEKAQKLVSLWNESNRLDDEADKLIDEHGRLSRTNQTEFDSAENERKHSDLRARARDLQNEANNMLLREAEANGWEQGEDAEIGGVRWVKKPTPSDNKMARAKAAADRHVVVYGNGQKGTLADLIKNGGARLYPEKGLTVFDKGKPHVVTIGFQQFTPTKDELPYLVQLQKDYDAAHPDDVPPSQRKEPPKTAPASESGAAPDSLSQTPFSGVEMTAAQRDKILSLTQSNGEIEPIVRMGNIASVVKKDSGDIVLAESMAGRKNLDDGFEVLRITKDGMFVGSIFYNSNGNMLWPNGHYDEKNHVPGLIEDGDLPSDFVSRLKTLKSAPTSAPSAEGTSTPPKSADAPRGGESAENAAPVRENRTTEKSSQVATPRTPSFKRGDKVFLKGTAESQRVTFLKANADGTADVQVKTPGTNRYAPEKVETRTVPIGDISATGEKGTLTEAEKKRLDEGMKEQAEPSIKMKDEVAEKLARQQEDDLAALFDTQELGVNFDTQDLSADLSEEKNAKKFKSWVSGLPSVAAPSQLPSGSPKAVFAWFEENMVGKTFAFDIPGYGHREFTVAPGHIGKLVCEGPDKGIITKKLSSNWQKAVRDGEVDAKDVRGWDFERARSLPRLPVVLTQFDAVLHEVDRGSDVFIFLKKFNTKNGRPNTIVMKLIDDGKTIGPIAAHIRDLTLSWLKNKDLILTEGGEVYGRSADNSASRQPLAGDNAEGNSQASADSIPQSGGEGKGDAIALNFDTPELAGVNVRTKAPPKKTGIGYKVFVRGKDGGLYPPMVANPNGAATPVGVWIDASEGVRAEQSKTGRNKVKAGGKGTNGGGGSLAWRPGWHLGEIPYALQFNVGPKVPNPLGIKNAKGEVIKIGEFFPGNFVWAEVEYAADVDYQDEAMSYGRTPSGKFNHALAGLPRLPVDGSYKYRTNANPATDPWIITGSMKVNRVLTDADVDAIVRRAGREPQKRESEVVQKFLAWAKKWKLDPSKQKVRDEWAQRNGVSFDTPEFDPDMFQKRVGAVAKLVKTYKDSGVADFKTLATRMAERFPDKFGAMKPYLRGVWNAVAEQMDLDEVSKPQADDVYGIIEAKAKEVDNGDNGTDGDDRGAGGVRTAAGGGERPGGVLAGGRVRSENTDERVGSVGTGAVSGLGGGLAETQAAGEGASGTGGASEGAVPVTDSAGHGERERDAGGDSSGNGSEPAAGVKKPAEKAADSTKVNPIRRDFVMTKAVEDAILEKRTADRVRNNIAAIKLIRELAKRDYAATPAEQETLAKFVGWGGLREAVFNYDLERAYDAERSGNADLAKNILRRRNISQNLYDLHKELRSILNDKEYDSAKRSSSTAFYTPVGFVRALHDALRNLGVKGGRFLGPSAGTGNFASAAGQYEKPVNWQFVEKDAMTGEILKALFPNQRVTIGGFEETKFPDGFFDFAIDNVPYADVPINDRSLSSKMFKIHDYFFAKTLAKLRPGGVMAFLTSTGTLDKTSPVLRQFLTEHGGRIVGAVRLPNGFFSENAGTEAASDLVIVQKVDGRPDNSAFEKGVEYGFTEQWERRKGMVKKPLTYNGYFRDHPEQIVGKMEATSGQYGPRLNYAMPDGDMMDGIRRAVARAFDGIDRDALLKNATVAEQEDHAPIYDESGLRQGNVTLKDGKPFVKSGEMLVPVSMPNDQRLKKELMKRGRTGKGILSDLFALRKAMRDLIDAQMADTDTTETDLAPLQKALGDAYDAFVKKNGTLHDRWVAPFVLLDKADGNRMLALERVVKGDDGKQKVVKSDIFTKRVISRGQRASRAETPKDALVISYSESGGINVPRIAELLGVDEETAIAKLKESGDAFENPQTGRLEPSWEYLSGRVRAKLAAARAALESGEDGFRANVEALEKVQPPMVKLEDTEIKFGATWIEPDVMSDFMRDAFGSDRMQVKFVKNEATGQWEVPRASGNVANNESPWGETSWDPLTFVLRVLNHGSMNHIVTDPVTKKKYLDERKTEANKLAAEKMHQAFAEFIMSSDQWAEPMYERYNAVMTDMVEIRLPNNVLPFRSSGMSESAMNKLFEGGDPAKPKKGREYQSAVIARGVLGGSSLCLAHCVGAGKTLEMQSIGMMGRRLGMFKKPMYVVPNHMLEQFVNEFVDAFPNANILKMSEDDVKPENRRAFFAQVANGDWDAIVVKRSTFSKKLAMSTEYQKNYLQSQIDDMAMVIEAMRSDGNGVSVDKANKIREKLQAKLEHLVNAENHDSEIVPFEELGIDQLFIDEAHNFKGLPIVTSQGRTGGLSQGDSQQAIDMQMKTEYVQSLHGGNRGVVFATGTPLSNAPVVESYVILKYLAPNRLKEQGLEHFDDFVGAFGRITTESEFSLDGRTVKERDKVSAFVNIPELMRLFKSVVDIVNPDQLDIPRPKPKYHMIDVDMSPTQARIMEMVADFASMPFSREDRNRYLDLTRIAKNACLTPRLIGFADGGNKVIRAVSEIKRVYDETSDNRGAQLVFTDMFNLSEKTSRNAFDRLNYLGFTDERPAPEMLPQGQDYNLNEEIRDLLVQAGIPKEEIAIIQDIDKSKGDKDANKSALFAKVRSGEVRVLIGSRPKMGEGTNVQERLAAIHLLHPGWKPAEDEQAIGRIIRFGNTYKEGQIFYYLTKGNSKVGSYETKNHQIVGVKGRLIDQVMHGDDTIRVIEMDENAMDRDMLMGLASGNKALMELIDVNKRVHKLELNTESTASSARRLKMKAEVTERDLDRRAKEFEKTRKGIDRWNEANKDKPFEIETPDGRTIDKVGEMAQYVSAQVSKQLTKDAYDRDETVRLGEINGIPVVATFDAYDDQKVKIAVPTLGIEREINYSGFIPDFSTGAMTAFKKSILDIVDPSYAEEFDARIEDLRKQAKKMSADAENLQKDFDAMSKELSALRSREAQLEREVTPLVVQTVKDRKVAQYGSWFVEKSVGKYSAIREQDGKELRAATVRELIPLMDAEDFARPGMAATKTRDLTKHLKPDSKGNYPGTFEVPVEKVNFDTPELTPAEAEYAASDDKTPTEKVMREVYGMTNDEVATALRAAGMEPPPHVRKPDEVKWQQAEALLSNPTYMAKLSRAVAKFPRPLRDYEIDALNVLFRERQNAVNAAQGEVDDWKQTLDSIADGEVGAAEKKEDARKNLAAAQSGLARAKALMLETAKAKIGGASEQGRGLRANRGSLYQDDLTYAGITGEIARIVGGAERVTPEMDAKIRDLAKLFEDLDEQGLRIATERLKPLAEKVIKQTKDGLKVRKATERRAGDEAKRVTRNYEDALNQIEVGAAEVGGTLIGLSDQQYPSWGRWLKAIGEFHCFQNPDITEEEVINAILEDISPFMDGVDANQVRDALTGFGHNFKQSRYDSQRLMNDLKSQARLKRQLDWMDENNTMPPLTGMVRDEPSDVTRNLQKQVAERKKEVPDAGRDERRLKGVLDSAKTRVRNRIADIQRAIETGERIPASQRKVVEDLELRELKRQKEELQKAYDELFKTERSMTDAQRIALTEKLLAKELERALEDLDRARAGDFSKRPKRPGVESPTIDMLRDRIAQTREQIRELKKAKYEFGMTPEEIAALNARKMANREKAVARLAERIATGDLRPQKKPQPPMTPDQQKRYDELGEQMKRGRQKLSELRLEAENATVPTFWRGAGNFLRFVTTAQRALRATMDFSAVLRQAARMTLAHPVKAARAFGKAWTAARSEASLQDVNDEIMSDPTVQEAVKKYGLHLREVDATNARDVEMFHGMERNRIKLFGKEFAITDIPFFGEFMLKSERHYLTYLNAMSAEIYSSIVNDARRFPGGATPWQKKMVADMVNVWNGSAALSEKSRRALQDARVNDIFWAPQLAISRVQSAVGYDWWHPLTAKGMENGTGGFDPVSSGERKAAAKAGLSEHLRSTIAMLAIGALLKWMFSDDDDKYNFSQADWFEKMMMLVSPKVGNTTIDLTGGESTFDRLVYHLATKLKRTGKGRLQKFGDFNGPDTWSLVGRYLQGKVSPSISTVFSLRNGKDYVGDEYGVGKMTQEMLIPLTFEDVKDQLVQNGVGMSLVTVPLTLLGAGGSTYDRKPYENAVNRFLEEKRAYDAISKDAELSQAERKELLDGMKSESPLMTDSVRGDIDARIKAVNRLERKAKDIEKKGGTPTASLTNEIERQKSILLDKIRRSRRK